MNQDQFMMFFCKEVGRLSKARQDAGFDSKQEQSTYNNGYVEALLDISKVMVKKTNLE